MSIEPTKDILIAGGGIAGLAAWRALEQHGVRSTVIERRMQAVDGGLAINLPGNAIAALARLGLGEGIGRIGHPVRRREYRAEDDRLLAAIDEDAFWGEAMRPRAVRRADLVALLGEGMPSDRGRFGSAVTAITQDAEAVHVQLATGETLSGRLLIGADGVHSTARESIMGTSESQSALIASASWRFMAPNPGIDGWTFWTGRRGMILLLPVDDSTVYGWVTVSEADTASDDHEHLRRTFARFPERARKALDWVLSHPEQLYHSPLEEVQESRWHDGRVTLIGDAAHATAPVWAQGAALAMEDSLALAALVAGADDPASIGDRFRQQRMQRVAHVKAMTDRLSKAAGLPYPVRRMIMPFIVPRRYKATYGPLRDSQ
jgi:2-polyprenyl-6-methoxyphenol hydroxylase-like FAD-dependent oxidoreductase